VFKPGKKFSKRVIAFIFISNSIALLLFLAAYIIVKAEPKTLIVSWFGFTGTECLALAGLRIAENWKKPSETNTPNEEDCSL
jgi:hypothetical protein